MYLLSIYLLKPWFNNRIYLYTFIYLYAISLQNMYSGKNDNVSAIEKIASNRPYNIYGKYIYLYMITFVVDLS